MRRNLTIALSVAALGAAAALFVSPSPVVGQTEGEGFASFEVIKDVHGDGPSSGFDVEFSCVQTGPDSTEGSVQTGTLHFDNLVDGNETQVVTVDRQSICTIEETNSNGADLVEYECEFFAGSTDEGANGSGCLDDQSASFTGRGDFGSFLVRNTFDPDVLPDDEEPDVAPDVVAASPSFTG
jgi:hypothetical protein